MIKVLFIILNFWKSETSMIKIKHEFFFFFLQILTHPHDGLVPPMGNFVFEGFGMV